MSIFDTFERKHDYLVCVDSDGCVMDTMNCKHFNCFGPCMVTEWGLEEWKDEILEKEMATHSSVLGESQGRGSPVGCRLWGRTESDTTEAT